MELLTFFLKAAFCRFSSSAIFLSRAACSLKDKSSIIIRVMSQLRDFILSKTDIMGPYIDSLPAQLIIEKSKRQYNKIH